MPMRIGPPEPLGEAAYGWAVLAWAAAQWL